MQQFIPQASSGAYREEGGQLEQLEHGEQLEELEDAH